MVGLMKNEAEVTVVFRSSWKPMDEFWPDDMVTVSSALPVENVEMVPPCACANITDHAGAMNNITKRKPRR